MIKVIIVIIFIASIIIGLIFLTSHFAPSNKKPPLSVPTASIAPNALATPPPNLSLTAQGASQSAYTPGTLPKDLQRITSPQPLSSNDLSIRNKLISLLGNASGTLIQSDTYGLEYVKSPDVFMIELRSTNTDQSEQDALGWLKAQGLSNQGICNLPVKIYLSYSVSIYFRNNNLKFNPIPPSCE